jgi:hypothetical protein
MNKLSKNQKGFTVVEALLFILIVAVIGFGGYYVWHTQHNKKTPVTTTSTSSKSSTSTKPITTATTTPNPYAGWKQYCSTYEKSCFKYPSTWTLTNECSSSAPCPSSENIVLISPDKSTINFESSISGRGGECQPGSADSFITSVTPLPNIKSLYLVQFSRADIDGIALGVDDTINGAVPKTGDTGSCFEYTSYTAKNTPNAGVDLSGNVSSSAKSADLSDAIKIINSYYYQ